MISRLSVASFFALVPALALAGCGATSDRDASPGNLVTDSGSEGGSDFDVAPLEGGVFQEIAITPSNAVLYIDTCTDPATAAKQAYTAKMLDDGTDVTGEIALNLDDNTLGTFAGASFTSATSLPAGTLGVTTVVHGSARGKSGTANLTLVALRQKCDRRDFFFLEPYHGAPTPAKDVLKFGTNIKQVDVAFNVDTTGSMGGAIENLQANLSTKIFPNLKTAIPNVGIAVVDFKDEGDTWVTKVTQKITTDVTAAQSAAATLSAGGGGDEPEADICSMMHVITGKACSTTPEHTPTAGTFGAVEFRPGSLPVVVNVTDAHWHDPSGGYGLESDLMPAFKKNNVRFVGVTEMHYASSYTDLEDMTNYLSDYTDSNVAPDAFGSSCPVGKCCTGQDGTPVDVAGPKKRCRLNFHTMEGNGLADSVVSAISALSVGSVFDVTAVPSNDPTNPDGVDAVASFVQTLRAMDEGGGTTYPECKAVGKTAVKDTNGDGVADTFLAIPVGTPVCFEVLPKPNNTVKPKDKAQFFNAFVDVLGMPGSVKLDRRTVIFLVPPTDPAAR